MRNYKITIQYEGTRFQGWQRQDSTDNTIQGKFEAILSKMTGTKVQVDGSGRTDAGVHAYGQVANFHIDTPKTPQEIMAYINEYLPEDIGVIAIEEVDDRFHSRLHAAGKTYRYRIWNTTLPAVFERRYVYEVSETIDTEAMKRAASYLVGKHDFRAFTSNKRTKKSTVRTIEAISIEQKGYEIDIMYSGDGFLYHMVRILTGTLLEIGLGKKKPEEVQQVLQSGLRENAGPLVPAKGLSLIEVRYAK